jgi:hypothetical protein
MGIWRERNFRLVFIAQAISGLGTMLVPVALSFAVLDLTGSASDLGLVLGSGALALVVFMLAGGVVADRMPRQVVMIAADGVQCLSQLALGVLLVVGHPPVLLLACLTAVTGAATAMFAPAANGLTPALVPAGLLQRANALLPMTFAVSGLVGPVVAGVLVETAGPGWAIVLDALTYALSALLLSRLRLQNVPRQEQQHWIADLRAGWTDFWNRTWFRAVALSFAAINLFYAAYLVLGPVVCKRDYDGAASWATVSAASGAGSLIAGLAATRLRPRHPLRVAVLFGLFSGLGPLAFSGRMPIWLVACAAALDGAGVVLFESLWQTTVQTHIPEEMLSRASSYDYFASFSVMPVGMAIAAPLASVIGLRPMLLASAVLTFGFVLAMLGVRSVRELGAAADAADPALAADPG